MIKIPSFVNYKKKHRHILRVYKLKQLKLLNNSVKILSRQKGYLSLNQILGLRIFFRKTFKKRLKIFMPLLVNYHKTYKGVGMRMGKGKGRGKKWYIGVSKGSIIMEFIGSKYILHSIFRLIKFLKKKIPLKTTIKLHEKNIQTEYTA